MKTFKNVLQHWIYEGKECRNGEEFAAWCLLSSLMIMLAVGFAFLAWFFPIVASFVFLIVFFPICALVYIRFNDVRIDERIKLLKEENDKYKKYHY